MEYEICFWLKDLGTDSLPLEDQEKIRQAILNSGGSILTEKTLEKRSLAYPIKKQKTGFWGELQFSGASTSVEGVRKALQYEPNILRKMIFELKKPKKIRKLRTLTRKIESFQKEPRQEERVQVSEEVLDTKLKEILDNESR
ncbi:MAG: 30S ribosomal protein S6 [Parcubacteria group bacterium GW2011_GWC1_45_9]|nr:MAG: 30S ribosomal protein S6 [Parcubacteria group bacterium GW2011_GWA1_Parcubacteria_45_10]KKT88611.1 MAG: 30S ribosomal protein S6 [Parcubacteria group bacterium GW2011_GWB1_45_10]KKU17051.1 MAG: 30S ribosomal protein S6 [Parcubacteria group bacterium GW2011_GWC1_45_9]HCI05267.1 30S ribosomal protein S6 [Patescibacteria group bacterium]